MRLKYFIVSYMTSDARWVTCGRFRARTPNGALQQFAKDLAHLPLTTAIRAVPA